MKNAISNIATRVSLKAQSLKDSAKKGLGNENGDSTSPKASRLSSDPF